MPDHDTDTTAPTTTIRVALADDHEVVRSGLRRILESQPDVQVVAEAADVDAARRMALGYKPDVLILDLNMPGGSSLEAIPRIVASSPSTAVVVLTMQSDPSFARQALRAGARGYVLKEAANAELLHAVRETVAGRTYLHPSLGAAIATAQAPAEAGPADGLTSREVEVLRLIALGHTNAEVADGLFLSVRTVESHRAHIQQKLCLSTRAELVAYALEHGLVGSRASAPGADAGVRG